MFDQCPGPVGGLPADLLPLKEMFGHPSPPLLSCWRTSDPGGRLRYLQHSQILEFSYLPTPKSSPVLPGYSSLPLYSCLTSWPTPRLCATGCTQQTLLPLFIPGLASARRGPFNIEQSCDKYFYVPCILMLTDISMVCFPNAVSIGMPGTSLSTDI